MGLFGFDIMLMMLYNTMGLLNLISIGFYMLFISIFKDDKTFKQLILMKLKMGVFS